MEHYADGNVKQRGRSNSAPAEDVLTLHQAMRRGNVPSTTLDVWKATNKYRLRQTKSLDEMTHRQRLAPPGAVKRRHSIVSLSEGPDENARISSHFCPDRRFSSMFHADHFEWPSAIVAPDLALPEDPAAHLNSSVGAARRGSTGNMYARQHDAIAFRKSIQELQKRLDNKHVVHRSN